MEKWGGGMHSLAVRIADLDATRRHLEEVGVGVLADVQDGIVFTRPGDTAGLLLEWSAIHTDDDPRWGFPLREREAPPIVEVQEYAFMTALVADPVAVAERLGEVFGTEVVRRVPGAGPGEVGAVLSLLDCLLVLIRLPEGGVSRAEWGQDVTRPRFHAQGLRVPDLAAATAALAAAGIGVSPGIEGGVLVAPGAVSLPTYLVEELLPEDPRRSG